MRTPSWGLSFALFAAALANAQLLGQQVWLVAPSGGHFTNLQNAIDSTASGDTLIVRGGSHGSLWIDHDVTIVGDQPRPLVQNINIYAGAKVSAQGLSVNNRITVQQSSLASFEDITAVGLEVRSSHAVFTGCTLGIAAILGTIQRIVTDNSHVVLDRCELHGNCGFVQLTPNCQALPGGAALAVANGALVEIAHSTLAGAPATLFGCLNSPGTSGIEAGTGTSVRLGQCTITAPAGVPAVTGNGVLAYEGTTFSPLYAGGTQTTVPIVSGSGAPVGGTMNFELRSAPLLPAALVACLGQRNPVQVPQGLAWIDRNASVLLGIGFLDAGGAMSLSISIPLSAPRGLPLSFQGVVAPGLTAPLLASSPTILHVR